MYIFTPPNNECGGYLLLLYNEHEAASFKEYIIFFFTFWIGKSGLPIYK